MSNPSTDNARTIVEWLLDAGMTEAVIAPGSRSAPLSYAFAQAAQAGEIRMHVRIDERDAGFLALGLSKTSGRPVPVVVTSGTAVANLLPAVIEGFYSGIELVVVSADRPATQRNRRSPQTIEQASLFGKYALAVDLAVDADVHTELSHLIHPTNPPQPLHINAQFDVPLMPTDSSWSPQRGRHSIPVRTSDSARIDREVPSRGLIIAGDINDAAAVTEITELATSLGWPIVWEPTANVHSADNAIAHGPLVLPHLPNPDCILTIGAVGLSRVTLAALRTAPQHLVVHLDSSGVELPDPTGTAHEVFSQVPSLFNTRDDSWLALWKSASQTAGEIVRTALQPKSLIGQRVAVDVWNHANDADQLFIAASWPVRHIEAYAPTRTGLRTLGNRGANGIDGLVSTAWGSALTSGQRTYLLIGDIAFLHDAGGLNVSTDDTQPNLTIVVSDNDGSGIFGQLEQGAPDYAQHYERIFGTPHGKDLWVIAESFGIPAQRVTTADELERALVNTDKIPGVHVIVCTVAARADEAALIKSIAAQVASALQ